MPATSQQGFSCEAGIRATGAVDLLCTFADGAACATRVGSERFSTTITAKANVVDFFVITEPPADSTQYIGKSCFSITTHNWGEQAEPLSCGSDRKEDPLLSSTPAAGRILLS